MLSCSMNIVLEQWQAKIQSFLYASEDWYKALERPHAGIDLSDAGALLRSLHTAWVSTLSVWEDASICGWGQDDLNMQGTWTQKLLDVLCNDYLYRTNIAPPSDLLWQFLESQMDMPSSFKSMLNAWDARHGTSCFPQSVMRRHLGFVSLCRPNQQYPLEDDIWNRGLWPHMDEMQRFWSMQQSPQFAQHSMIVDAIKRMPMANMYVYAYAEKKKLPDATIVYLLNDFAPLGPFEKPSTMLHDATMQHWCTWLSELQETKHWHSVQVKWPDLASLIEIVSSLENNALLGTTIWPLYMGQANTLKVQELPLPFDCCYDVGKCS